jgi:hypothetical protein
MLSEEEELPLWTLMAGKGRAANTADAKDVAKVLRANMQRLPAPDVYCNSDLDLVVHSFEDTLVDLLHCTLRPTGTVLTQAAVAAFDVDAGTASLFAQRLMAALAHCRLKSKSTVSGKKLHPSVLTVVRALNTLREPGIGQKLVAGAAKLRSWQVSPPSKPSAAVVLPARSPVSDLEVPASSPKARRATASSSQSSKKARTREEIFKELGVTPPRSQRATVDLASPTVSVVAIDESPAAEPQLAAVDRRGPEPSELKKEYVEYTDNARACRVRLWQNGRKEFAIMTPGPAGFARSAFDSELPCETEIPNLMLHPLPHVMKKPAAARGRKRDQVEVEEEADAEDAGAAEEDLEAEDAEQDEEDDTAPPAQLAPAELAPAKRQAARNRATAPAVGQPKTYLKMFYKNTGAFGFRERGGGQVFQLVCKKMPKAQLEKLADQVLDRLNAGQNVLAVRDWAKEQLKK